MVGYAGKRYFLEAHGVNGGDPVLRDPTNPLGTRALYLSWQYYRIHGTHDTRKIGRRSSNGCIGLYNEHIEEVFDRTPVGWIMSRMVSDTNRLSEVVAWSLVDIAWGGTTIVVISSSAFTASAGVPSRCARMLR